MLLEEIQKSTLIVPHLGDEDLVETSIGVFSQCFSMHRRVGSASNGFGDIIFRNELCTGLEVGGNGELLVQLPR